MNVNKLKAKIVEKGLNVSEFASIVNKDRSSLYRKLSNPKKITIGDVEIFKQALGLTKDEASDIFLD